MPDTKIIARPWQPQDLIDDLQGIIDEECDNYLNTRRTTLCMARDYLKEHFSEPQWISVKDRLPENICPVLVALEGLSTAFNGWYRDGKWWTVGAGTRPFTQKVTHWMPLPEPPKGE